MGACCTTEQKFNIKALMTIQFACKRYLARIRLEKLRMQQIDGIIGKSLKFIYIKLSF
jgi:hypothetical protein